VAGALRKIKDQEAQEAETAGMFEQIEQRWLDEEQSSNRWTVYRAWIGVGLALLTVVVLWLEKSAK
jgi:hypothetical protein